MAYISAQEQDDEEQRQQVQAPVPGMAGAPAQAPQAAPAQQPAAAAPKQSRFVGFGRYLSANRDAASATAGPVSGATAGAGVQKDLGTATADFGKAVSGGTMQAPMQYVAPVAPRAAPVAKSAAGAPAPQQPQASAPGYGGSSDAQLTAMAGTQYAGPSSMSGSNGWAALTDRARSAQDDVNATATPGGLGALLQRSATTPYSSGARGFDQALVGSAGAGQFADARSKYGRLSESLTAANTASEGVANAGRATTEATAAGAVGEQGRRAGVVAEVPAFPDKGDWRSFNAGAGNRADFGGEAVFNQMTPEEVDRARYLQGELGFLGLGGSGNLGSGSYDKFAQAMKAKYGSTK